MKTTGCRMPTCQGLTGAITVHDFDVLIPAVLAVGRVSRVLLRVMITSAAVVAVTFAATPVVAEPVRAPIKPVAGATGDVLASVDSGTTLSLPGLRLPVLFGSSTAIVVLGYGLLPDGSMQPELVDRLQAGYVSALLSPAAPVIVTGGNPQAGVSEAAAMAGWLIARGIDAHRIHTETQANSTVQNASFSAKLMKDIGAQTAILVTSADHIARASTDFQAAGIPVVATMTPDRTLLWAEPFGR